MGKSCTILAHVRKPDGTIVESKFFKDLLHYTSNDRKITKVNYKVGTDQSFIEKAQKSDKFQTDENGEITLSSFIELTHFSVEDEKLLEVLKKDIGEGIYSYNKALEIVGEFNKNNPWKGSVLATMYPSGEGKYFVTVVAKNKSSKKDNIIEGKQEETSSTGEEEKRKLFEVIRNEEVEKRLKALLERHKVSVKFLEGDREGGRYSTENIRSAEKGMYSLIEIIEKGNTTESLAEEAGHFAIGALGDNPLVERLEKLLAFPESQREALGDEEFDSSMLGSNPAREVAGRLVGKALLRRLGKGSMAKVLANRIANVARRVFFSITKDELRYAAAKAEQIANEVAYNFKSGSPDFSVDNALKKKETMYSSPFDSNQMLFRDVMDELGRTARVLTSIADDSLAKHFQADLGLVSLTAVDDVTEKSALQIDSSREQVLADSLAFDGIVQAVVRSVQYLGQGQFIDSSLSDASALLSIPSEFYNNMANCATKLRQVRAAITGIVNIAEFIKSAVTSNSPNGQLVMPNGSTLHNVRYQDEEGNWKSIDLGAQLDWMLHLALNYKTQLGNLEKSFFIRFCEDVYGSKYISGVSGILWTNPYGDKEEGSKENVISIRDLVLGNNMDDIDIFHRYLGAMADNPDVIGQIVDRAVRNANKVADDKTIQVQKEAAILQKRAEALGLNFDDLLEKDENGHITGNIITPPAEPSAGTTKEESDFIYEKYMDELGYVPAVNHGDWEQKREEKLKELREGFKTKYPDWQNMPSIVRGLKFDEYSKKKLKNWHKENSFKVKVTDDKTGKKYTLWIPNAKYASDAWDNLLQKYKPITNSKGRVVDTLSLWVSDYLAIKKELDSQLGFNATLTHRLPQFKGTLGNKTRNAVKTDGIAAGAESIRRDMCESFAETAEDEDFGDMHSLSYADAELLGTRLNYEEERCERLTTFGVRKLKNLNDLSSDLTGSLVAYASMSNSNFCLSSIVDALEVGRQALLDRNIQGKDSFLEKAARKVAGVGDSFRKSSGKHAVKNEGEPSRAYVRYIKYLHNQVYGIKSEHYGFQLGKKRWLLEKISSACTKLAGFLYLGGNVPGGIVNTGTGILNISKEALTNSEFSPADVTFANKYYFENFFPMWLEAGVDFKSNKLSLFIDKMNALGKNKEMFRGWHAQRNFVNNFLRELIHLPYSSGDHYMQSIGYLAIAHRTKLYDPVSMTSKNLWDSYEKDANQDVNGNTAGKTLLFDGIVPVSASDITVNNLDKLRIKEVERNLSNFQEWLVSQDPQYANEDYKRSNPVEYGNYKDQFYKLSDRELVQWSFQRYNVLSGVIKKIYDAQNNPVIVGAAMTAQFSPEEEDFITSIGYNPNNVIQYDDIVQVAKNKLYNLCWSEDSEAAYMQKARAVNVRLHGIYDHENKTIFHQNLYGRMLLAMKGWVLGYLEYMYAPNHYNIALGKYVEGMNNTALKNVYAAFSSHIDYSLLDMAVTFICPWSPRSKKAMIKAGFSKEQNYNMRRFTASVALLTLLYALKCALAPGSGDDDDDEEDRDVWTQLSYYMSYRLLLEQTAFLGAIDVASGAFGGSYQQIFDLMPVGIAAIKDLTQLSYEGYGLAKYSITEDEDLLKDSSFFYQQDDKNGKYEEGDSKFEVHLRRLIPYVKSIWGLQHGDAMVEGYDFGRKMRSR